MFSMKRLAFNSTMYTDSIVPEHWPGGGGFAVMKFTLESLYEQHQRCRNWWTSTNEDLPLCRYLGCSIKAYQCEKLDYVLKYDNELPGTSNKLTYASCQPSMMLMNNNKIIIPSKRNERRKRPYKKIFIPAPPQFQTKWYFQTDLYKTSLFVLHCTACSLSNYYVKPKDLSNNITFSAINTELIQNRNFATNTNTSWYYKKIGDVPFYFYHYINDANLTTDLQNVQIGDLAPLTNPREDKQGWAYNDPSRPHLTTEDSWSNYVTNLKQYMGNPFNKHNLEPEAIILYSQRSPEATFLATKQPTTKWKDIETNRTEALTLLSDPIIIKFQYNPQTDTGKDTYLYLLKITEGHGWDPPLDEDILLTGFPLWLGLYGYIDIQKKLKKLTNIDTTTVLTIKTKSTWPKTNIPIVIINDDFQLGHSPYETTVLGPDFNKWYPQVQYQTKELNKIVKCGPATPYIDDDISDNVRIFYKFYFKWGGSPPKMITVENPAQQAQYPIPRNQYETTSLQSPAQAPESLLYSFDQRHGSLTTTALRRITEDWQSKSFISSITDSTTAANLKKAFQALQESEEEEQKKNKEIQQLLFNLRQQQQDLRDRIMSLLETK